MRALTYSISSYRHVFHDRGRDFPRDGLCRVLDFHERQVRGQTGSAPPCGLVVVLRAQAAPFPHELHGGQAAFRAMAAVVETFRRAVQAETAFPDREAVEMAQA